MSAAEPLSAIRARFGTAMRGVVLTSDHEWGDELVREYQSNPDIRFIVETGSEDTLRAAIPKYGANLVLVDHGLTGNETGLAVAERVAQAFPKVQVYLASTEPGQALVALHNAAVSRGIRSVIGRPFTSEALVTVVSSILTHDQQAQDMLLAQTGGGGRVGGGRRPLQTAGSHLVAVAGGKGGVGKSQVSVNLAAMIRANPTADIATALADLERYAGSTHLLLGPTIAEKVRITDWLAMAPDGVRTLDPGEVRDSLMQELSSGLHVLAAPECIEDHDQMTAELVTTVLNNLRLMHTVTVVDLPAETTEPVLTAMHLATVVVLVTNLDKPALNKSRAFLGEMRQRGVDMGKVWVLFNRVPAHGLISVQDAANVLSEYRICGTELPEDPEVQRTRDLDQVTVLDAPDCPWSRALRRAAADILPGLGLELAAAGLKGRQGGGRAASTKKRKFLGLF